MKLLIQSLKCDFSDPSTNIESFLDLAFQDIEKKKFSSAIEKLNFVDSRSLSPTIAKIVLLLSGVANYFYTEIASRTVLMNVPTKFGIMKRPCTYNVILRPKLLEAKKCFEEVLKMDTKNAVAFLGLGKTLIKLQDHQKGFENMIKAANVSSLTHKYILKCKKIYQKYPTLKFIGTDPIDAPESTKILTQLASPWAYDRVDAVYKIGSSLKIMKNGSNESSHKLLTLLRNVIGSQFCGLYIPYTGDEDIRVRDAANEELAKSTILRG